jgi:hypothetical protein
MAKMKMKEMMAKAEERRIEEAKSESINQAASKENSMWSTTWAATANKRR